jgi:hypothetical protein
MIQIEDYERQIAVWQLASILAKGPRSIAWWQEELSLAANCLPDGDEEKPCIQKGGIRIKIVSQKLHERICEKMLCAEETALPQGVWLLTVTTFGEIE